MVPRRGVGAWGAERRHVPIRRDRGRPDRRPGCHRGGAGVPPGRAHHRAVARRPRGGGGLRPVTAPPTPPFTILRPSGTPTLVFDSPHSGRLYPPDFAVK